MSSWLVRPKDPVPAFWLGPLCCVLGQDPLRCYKRKIKKNRHTRTMYLRFLGGFLGSRDGAVVRALASHQCVPGSIPAPGVICGLSLLLVLYSAPRGFSPGTPVFPSP